jgi:hypothetical protein
MDTVIRSHFDNIHSSNKEVQGASYSYLMQVTAMPVDWAYEVWEELVLALNHKSGRERSIAAQLLCNLAKSDPKNRVLRDFEAILSVTKDEKFVTARHTLQSIWRIGAVGVKHQAIVLNGLSSRFQECIAEKNCTLIRYDILQSMRRLFDVTKDKKIQRQALKLIESEDDVKYRRKYETLWRN